MNVIATDEDEDVRWREKLPKCWWTFKWFYHVPATALARVLWKLLNFAETQHLLGLKNEYIRICWLVSDQKLKVIVL